jgi:hypothetical protein
MRTFAAAWVKSQGDKVLCFRMIRPHCKSKGAAERGAERMLNRPKVQEFIAEYRAQIKQNVDGIIELSTSYDPERDKLVKTIAITEIELINEYIGTALLDHLDYYDEKGQPKPLQSLTVHQRRQIKEIDWYPEDSSGKRRIRDYVLEDRDKARDQLAKITGIVNPAFDFAGLIAILTGKGKDEAQAELRRLNHSEGVNFEAIAKRAGVIEGEFTEVKQ